jgi:hypothetical protein
VVFTGPADGSGAQLFPGRAGTPALIFSIGQGFLNGPAENGDVTALQRMIDDINKFKTRYPVFALLDVRRPKDKKIAATLQLLKKNRLPFILDVYSSDVLTIAGADPAHDIGHGIPLSLRQLRDLRKTFGSYFAGLRIFEVLAQNFTVSACRHGQPWCRDFATRMPNSDFFDPRLADRFVAFAHQQKMFVVFADWYWSFDHQDAPPWQHQQRKERAVTKLLGKYKDTIIVMYDNNEPHGQSEQQFGKWAAQLAQFVSDGAMGLGLSDQSWICFEVGGRTDLDCPVEIIISWAKDAIEAGTIAIQTEPYWYWWEMPRGGNLRNYIIGSGGSARTTLRAFGNALGVGGI